jgi:hypothetical protein
MSSDYFVSPKHLASAQQSGNLDGAIDVFEAAVQGWMLDHAKALTRARYKNRQHAGFAILMLISSYFEAIEPYFVGSKAGKSHEKWRAGFRRVFPELAGDSDASVDSVYGEVRCGLYHSLSAGSRVQIASSGPAVKISVDAAGAFAAAVINPWEVLKRVDTHFSSYVTALRNRQNTGMRQNFSALYRVGAAPSQSPGVPARSTWP